MNKIRRFILIYEYMLCHVMSCYVMLCFVMLCYVIRTSSSQESVFFAYLHSWQLCVRSSFI